MRLLVLDGSRIMTSLVRRLIPEGVEIEEAGTFDDALTSLRERPPDAVIANLGPSELPWWEFKEHCLQHDPPIPILFESCVYESPHAAGLGVLDQSASFLTKPYGLADLRDQLERLLCLADSSSELEDSDLLEHDGDFVPRPRDS